MTTSFSSSESTALDRAVDIDSEEKVLSVIWNSSRLADCKQWISQIGSKKVCLQFPDDLLSHSAHIANELTENNAEVEVFILGDTSYGSCCVDEVAASHIDADAIIHFGHACLSKVSRLPVRYVFPDYDVHINDLQCAIQTQFPNLDEKLMIFYNVGYTYSLDSMKKALNMYHNIEFGKLAINNEPDMLCWTLGSVALPKRTCIYIGKDDQILFNLTLSLNAKVWFNYDPHSDANALKSVNPLTTNWMRRRYFYIEKCKDAQALGIVVGTLVAKGYLDLVKHIQALARNRGVRTYLISVGKVNPSKLANFSEVDCFVLIGCPENNLFTSRDFYKPLLSVFEVEMALNPVWHDQLPENYCVDFKELLPEGRLHRDYTGQPLIEGDVSLVSGQIRFAKDLSDAKSSDSSNNGTVQLKKNHQVMSSDSGSIFQQRSFTGLDQALGKTKAAKIEQGRAGLSVKYDNDLPS